VCVWVGVCGLWTRTYDDMTATYTDQYTANSAQKIHWHRQTNRRTPHYVYKRSQSWIESLHKSHG